MEHRYQRSIPASHPALVGHFPGNPLVPGVLLLNQIEQAIAEWQPNRRIIEISEAKFLTPLRPEQPFTIELKNHGNRLQFTCHHAETLFASGRLILDAAP